MQRLDKLDTRVQPWPIQGHLLATDSTTNPKLIWAVFFQGELGSFLIGVAFVIFIPLLLGTAHAYCFKFLQDFLFKIKISCLAVISFLLQNNNCRIKMNEVTALNVSNRQLISSFKSMCLRRISVTSLRAAIKFDQFPWFSHYKNNRLIEFCSFIKHLLLQIELH